MTEYVHILRAANYHPVYHRHDSERPWVDVYNHAEHLPPAERYREWVVNWYEKTPCGVRLPLTATFIQRERADPFARPCRRCFPDA